MYTSHTHTTRKHSATDKGHVMQYCQAVQSQWPLWCTTLGHPHTSQPVDHCTLHTKNCHQRTLLYLWMSLHFYAAPTVNMNSTTLLCCTYECHYIICCTYESHYIICCTYESHYTICCTYECHYNLQYTLLWSVCWSHKQALLPFSLPLTSSVSQPLGHSQRHLEGGGQTWGWRGQGKSSLFEGGWGGQTCRQT